MGRGSRTGLTRALPLLCFLALPLPALAGPCPTLPDGFGVESADGLTEDDCAFHHELRATLETLPPALRSPPGGPIVFRRHAEARPFATGQNNIWKPGAEFFDLWEAAPSDEPHVEWRLKSLSAEQYRRLWWRRAVIHALISRWDQQLSWSRRAAWRRISGWKMTGLVSEPDAPSLVYEGSFSRRQGMRSPQQDLVTFAEAALVPVESIAPEALDEKDLLRCQEFTKSRFLGDALREVAGDAVVPAQRPLPCRKFERWAQLETVHSFEVLFAAPSSVAPESVFGHVALRVVRDPALVIQGPSFETVFEFAAIAPKGDPNYLWKGLTGGFRGAFVATTLDDFLLEKNTQERRTVRRYRLPVSRDNHRKLMQRLWELERRGYTDYKFGTANCGWMLLFAYNGAVGDADQLTIPSDVGLMPAEAIDAMALAAARGESLRLLPDFESPDDRVRRLSDERRAHLRGLLDRPAQREAYAKAALLLDSSDPRERADGYRLLQLQTMTSDATRAVQSVSELSVDIEQTLTTLGQVEVESIDFARIVDKSLLFALSSGEALVAARQRAFEPEPLDAPESQLDVWRKRRESLKNAPRRSPTEEEQAALDRAILVKEAYAASLDLLDQFPRVEAPALDNTDRATASTGVVPHPTSGAGMTAVGAGVVDGRIGFLLRSARFNERLGDLRQNGIGATSEFRLLDQDLAWKATEGGISLQRLDLLLLRLVSMGRPAPQLDGPLRRLGYAVDVNASYWEWLDQPVRLALSGAVGLTLLSSPSFQNHLILFMGIAAEGRGSSLPDSFAVDGHLQAQARIQLPGRALEALRARILWLPGIDFVGPVRGEYQERLEADVSIAMQLGPLLVSPDVGFRSARQNGLRSASYWAMLMISPAW